jgi:hypothetical protein
LDESKLSVRETALFATEAALFATLTPSSTPSPTPAASPTATPVPATPTITPTPTADFAAFAATVRILLHEDIAQSAGAAKPFIAEALQRTGYAFSTTNGNIGTLADELKKKWDLVIIAAEMKANLQGEFFDMIGKHVYGGGSLIMETWLLDKVAANKFNYVLGVCGLEVQGDYQSATDRQVLWADPEHPLLQTPNQGIALDDFNLFWTGDLGDLLRKRPGSHAQVIGSTTGSSDSNAVLSSCLDGRVILQTFSSHDHKEEDMVPLWENYISYALQARYAQQQSLASLPVDPLVDFKEEAKVLVFKPSDAAVGDMAANLPYLNVLRYGGVAVTAQKQILEIQNHARTKPWDLIVVADYRGEMDAATLATLRQQLENGTSVVIEMGNLQAPTGGYLDREITKFLRLCGLEFAGRYTVGLQLAEDWLMPEHPLAQGPLPVRQRTGDQLGSLVKIVQDGRAELVGGVTVEGQPAGYVFTCYDGRLVFQALHSNQYDSWSMFEAWDRYIDYALRQRMRYQELNP